MFRSLIIILLAAWALGVLTSYTMGGWLHILLALALTVLVINLMEARGARASSRGGLALHD